MREILFRGKRIDNGEWITGGIFQQKADDVKDEVVYIIDNSSNDVDWAHRVIPETVGQFTGVTDKKGNRVFEGSIFRYEPHFTTEKAYLGIVKYRNTYDRQRACNDCGFVIEWQHEPLLTLREDFIMREILFRGKRIDNGEWITGGIFQQKADDVKDEVVYIIDNSSNDVDWAHRVIPETVGQFTGVTDKKGNRVFEGSIFRYEPHFTTEKAYLGIVKYRNTYDRQRACNDCGFVIEWQHEPLLTLREDLLYWCGDGKSASVIGNIHDNTELLEE